MQKFIYRYRPSSKYAINAFLENKTYAVNANLLNDFLDCSIPYNKDLLRKKLLKSKKARNYFIFNLYRKNIKRDDFSSIDEYFIEAERAESIGNIEIEDAFNIPKIDKIIFEDVNDIIEEFRNLFGVVCFSKTPDNPIMWSHYASDSKGFLIAYHYEALLRDITEGIEKHYKNPLERLVFGLFDITYDIPLDYNAFIYKIYLYKLSNEATYRKLSIETLFSKIIKTEASAILLRNILLNKKREWSYEREVRLIVPIEHSFTYNIDDSLKDEDKYYDVGSIFPAFICFGENMELTDKAALALYAKINKKTLLCVQQRKHLIDNGVIDFPLIKPDDVLKNIWENKI